MNKNILQNTDSRHFLEKQSQSASEDTFSNSKTPNPTLGTIRMVEETLSKMSEYPTKNKLWRALPRQIQYPSFKEILNYLEESNKIMYDKDGTIIWTFVDSPELEKLKEDTKPFS